VKKKGREMKNIGKLESKTEKI
jgi:hypothetical protein